MRFLVEDQSTESLPTEQTQSLRLVPPYLVFGGERSRPKDRTVAPLGNDLYVMAFIWFFPKKMFNIF